MSERVYRQRIVPEVLNSPDEFGVIVRIGRTGIEHPTAVCEIAEPVTFKAITPGQCLENYGKCVTLGQEEAQILLDGLWKCGLRPTYLGHYVTEQRDHIETLKDIVQFLTGQLKSEAVAHLKDQFINALKDDGIEIPTDKQQPETQAEGGGDGDS